ncbi:MAG: NAD(P)/FAD-dependent oxidoreductase [Ruminococcaceae bacterium]|nr:NAD(P)/FAD-dependent oxidoreductase [Oscillospiraceae bacterium]
MEKLRIAIIGAGAAGCVAALKASQCADAQITLFEKNKRIARKLLITGKGRCNLTNNCSVEEFIPNVVSGGKFLYSALNRFTPENTMEYFTSLGVELKTERGRRVFPASDRALDVKDALEKELLKRSNLTVLYQKVTSISKKDGIFTVKAASTPYSFDRVIIATGGKSYPKTGSDGDGYCFAKAFGHTVKPPKASLVPLVCKERFIKELEGLSLKNVTLSLSNGKKTVYKDMGEMLFTADGISGPLVLSASAHTRDLEKCSYSVSIDLKPALDRSALDKRLLSDFAKYQNKDFSNALGDLLPKKLIPVIIALSAIPPTKKVNLITKAERATLSELLKDLKLTVVATRPIDEAVITAGGVSLKEIDPKTMESKLCPGLFFAGEVIDADAYTGGYNLQIAFSTAAVAAESSTFLKKDGANLLF